MADIGGSLLTGGIFKVIMTPKYFARDAKTDVGGQVSGFRFDGWRVNVTYLTRQMAAFD